MIIVWQITFHILCIWLDSNFSFSNITRSNFIELYSKTPVICYRSNTMAQLFTCVCADNWAPNIIVCITGHWKKKHNVHYGTEEKNYLKQISLCIYNSQPFPTIEIKLRFISFLLPHQLEWYSIVVILFVIPFYHYSRVVRELKWEIRCHAWLCIACVQVNLQTNDMKNSPQILALTLETSLYTYGISIIINKNIFKNE